MTKRHHVFDDLASLGLHKLSQNAANQRRALTLPCDAIQRAHQLMIYVNRQRWHMTSLYGLFYALCAFCQAGELAHFYIFDTLLIAHLRAIVLYYRE
jgi:hypothetical protein